MIDNRTLITIRMTRSAALDREDIPYLPTYFFGYEAYDRTILRKLLAHSPRLLEQAEDAILRKVNVPHDADHSLSIKVTMPDSGRNYYEVALRGGLVIPPKPFSLRGLTCEWVENLRLDTLAAQMHFPDGSEYSWDYACGSWSDLKYRVSKAPELEIVRRNGDYDEKENTTKEKKVVPLDLWEKVTYALNRFVDEEENWEHEKGDRWHEGVAAVDAIEQFEIQELIKKGPVPVVDGVVLPRELLCRTIDILENYVEEDELADGYGGGRDSCNLPPAKELLIALNKLAEKEGKTK